MDVGRVSVEYENQAVSKELKLCLFRLFFKKRCLLIFFFPTERGREIIGFWSLWAFDVMGLSLQCRGQSTQLITVSFI